MRTFLQKHESIVDCYFKPTIKASQGDVIPHQKIVDLVYFYERRYINEQEMFIKVVLTKQMILDLAEEIKSIESEFVDMPFDELPF